MNNMTRAQVKLLFPNLLDEWKDLPENTTLEEQSLAFSDFHLWLGKFHPEAVNFRSRMGAEADLEQWFDLYTHQSWRN